jgi:hypothetical protein
MAGATDPRRHKQQPPSSDDTSLSLRVEYPSRTTRRSQTDVLLSLEFGRALAPHSRLWLIYEHRQDAGRPQTEDPRGTSYLSVRVPAGVSAQVQALPAVSRTLDLYPEVPEFHYLAEIQVGSSGLEAGGVMELHLARWETPRHSINPFRFWLLVDADAAWQFPTTGYRQYRAFVRREGGARVDHDELARQLQVACVEVEGDVDPVPGSSRRRTPGVFWGELHGMAFNQRPSMTSTCTAARCHGWTSAVHPCSAT